MVWARTLLFRREAPNRRAADRSRRPRVAAAVMRAIPILLAALALAAGGAGHVAAEAAGPGTASAEAGPPPAPRVTVPYYIAEAGKSRGPLSLDLIVTEIREGTVLPWTLVWKPGLSGWIRAGALPELAEALAMATPRPPPPPPQPPPPPPDPPVEEIYFVAVGKEVRGPLSEDEIAAAILEGDITRATLVWRQGTEGWAPAWDIPAIRGHFAATPPEVPVADAIRQLMIGTWEFVAEYGDGMVAKSTLEYRPDMTFSGFVTVTGSAGPATNAVSGAWSVSGGSSDRFALTLSPTGGKPGTVQLRVVDRDNLVNETDRGTARRIAD
jgi:hypothetical protein